MGRRANKIGLVLAQAPAYSETFLVNMVKGLVQNDFDVILFTAKRSPRAFALCKEVVSFPIVQNRLFRPFSVVACVAIAFIRNPRHLWRFCRLERTSGSTWSQVVKRICVSSHILPCALDYLHFGFATMGIDRENVGKAVGAKVSISIRGYDVSIFPLTRQNVYHRLWNAVDKVHTISEDLYQTALALGLPSTVPVRKIMPAIDGTKFVRSRNARISDEIKILTIARLQWKKGLEVAMDAMAILKSRGIRFRYSIVGEGREHDRLMFARHQLGLEDMVDFLGRKPHDEIARLMGEYDIYLQPSVQEGFCNSVLEAQASGLLCIVTNAEGLTENVLHGETGWVVPKWKPDALADRIVEVMQLEPRQIDNVRRVASNRVTSDFNLAKQNALFAAFFDY